MCGAEAGDHVGLPPAEPERPVRAVQAQVAPALGSGDECGAHLVTESGRSHELAVALAVESGPAGGGVQRRHVRRRGRQRRERVHVGTGELVGQALPDWRSDLDALVAEDDIVVERFTASGTHRGTLWGVAPTGKRLVLAGVNVFRLAEGRVVERWGRLDEAGLMRQLGLIPG